jgi:hypothetical protein
MHPALNLEEQVSVFMSRSDMVSQLYAQLPASLFFVYESQSYSKWNLTRIHMESHASYNSCFRV